MQAIAVSARCSCCREPVRRVMFTDDETVISDTLELLPKFFAREHTDAVCSVAVAPVGHEVSRTFVGTWQDLAVAQSVVPVEVVKVLRMAFAEAFVSTHQTDRFCLLQSAHTDEAWNDDVPF